MDTSSQAARILNTFRQHFGEPQLLVRGPGRLNLIGEHTDYNLGLVLPGAIDRAIWLALRPCAGRRCRVLSLDLGAEATLEPDTLGPQPQGWMNYFAGLLAELGDAGFSLSGFHCAFGGDVPIGSGLSSSAALLSAFGLGLNELFGLGLSRLELALLAQRAEARFAGVACGLMDTFASLHGQEGCLLRLDCRNLSLAVVPFPSAPARLVLCDSGVRRALARSDYNRRRAECETGVAVLARHDPEVRSLRQATLAMLEEHRAELGPVVARRCAYVIAENERVLAASQALERGDLETVGSLLRASHAGLRDDYEVSCPELDTLAAAADELPGVYGSRMMGAGFGGCTLHLVSTSALETFEDGMARTYRDSLGREPVLHVCRLVDGASVEWRAEE